MLPFSQISQHRQTVLRVYRTIIKNALHLDLPSFDDRSRARLIGQIRRSFRRQKDVNNSLVCQRLLLQAVEWNETLCRWYDADNVTEDPKYKELLKKVNPKEVEQTPAVGRDELSELIQANKAENTPTATDLKRQRQKRQLDSWIKLYIRRRQEIGLIPKKSKLDQRYIDEILKSKVLYDRREKVLQRVASKLRRPSTAGLKCANGTYNYIYVMFTPWNSRVVTEKGNFIYKQRKKHDKYLLDVLEFQDYKEKWQPLYEEEAKWESAMSGTRDDWGDIFKWYEKHLSDVSKSIEMDTINYNKRQYCYFQKLKPEFDRLLEDSRSNMHRLLKVIKAKQIGPYTDIAEGEDLGKLMKEHYFRDPSELDVLEKNSSSG
ncbi:DEKNAAC102157 [Brettanomyces naardenensis]|uniref:DEKNAAC102157 n=1 Tax=Brettanomyces naardenensis TaxID=13370 RepID=A0A448YK13_BRENA|nr:DEKNAAC102157 [Brettanomyces naardenensis]